MSLFHVLFAIAFALAFIRARVILALKHGRSSGVLVIDMTIALFLRRPSITVVFAVRLATFPRARVGLLVLTTISSAMLTHDRI